MTQWPPPSIVLSGLFAHVSSNWAQPQVEFRLMSIFHVNRRLSSRWHLHLFSLLAWLQDSCWSPCSSVIAMKKVSLSLVKLSPLADMSTIADFTPHAPADQRKWAWGQPQRTLFDCNCLQAHMCNLNLWLVIALDTVPLLLPPAAGRVKFILELDGEFACPKSSKIECSTRTTHHDDETMARGHSAACAKSSRPARKH